MVVEDEAAGVGRATATGDDAEIGVREQNVLAVGNEGRVFGQEGIAAGGEGGGGAGDGGVEEAFEIGEVAGGFDFGFGKREARLEAADALRDEGEIKAGGFFGRIDGAALVAEAGLDGEVVRVGGEEVVGIEKVFELDGGEDVGRPGEAGVLPFDLVNADRVEEQVF